MTPRAMRAKATRLASPLGSPTSLAVWMPQSDLADSWRTSLRSPWASEPRPEAQGCASAEAFLYSRAISPQRVAVATWLGVGRRDFRMLVEPFLLRPGWPGYVKLVG